MRSRILGVVCLVLCMGLSASLFAESVPFEINGEIRVRNENDARDFNSETGLKSFNLMRTRLGVSVNPAQDMHVFVQVQDSRVQGVASPSTTPGVQEDTRLDLHQGFFEVQNWGWTGFGVKAGRMEVRFGNERLVGVNDWDNVSRTFDGVMALFSNEKVKVKTLFANLVERDTPTVGDPDSENSDATLQGAFSTL
ncbi:MAG: alginate export family protein, partial [Candidatus Krumholzibacteriia bacterium]